MANQNQDIITYFQKLDRSFFMDEHKEFAYMDEAIPIGHEQTISQPSLVLEMTLAIDLQPHSKVLEIGTGLWLPDFPYSLPSRTPFTQLNGLKNCINVPKRNLWKLVSPTSISSSMTAAPVGKSMLLMIGLW